MKALDQIVIHSLNGFLDYINQHGWAGRENEAISLFAFGFLQKECSPSRLLYDPMQIGIEVAAADTPKGPNSQVRKDLVIWPTPGANRWYPPQPRSEPLAIMEWKVSRPEMKRRPSCDADIEWLSLHCADHRETTGYSILLSLAKRPSGIHVIRVDGEGKSELPIASRLSTRETRKEKA